MKMKEANYIKKICVYKFGDDNNYQLFKLKIHEFTFTTNVSNLPCRLNGIFYFVEMKEDGKNRNIPLRNKELNMVYFILLKHHQRK
jgi:hypothetical protein